MKAFPVAANGISRLQAASPFRAAGLRATAQRTAILQILDRADRPLGAEEILARMPAPRSGMPTVYRNLHQFALRGWVETIVCSDKTLRFIRCRSSGHHHHVQCDQCGKMVEVEGCGLANTLAAFAERSGFSITRHQLQLFGLCPGCQSR